MNDQTRDQILNRLHQGQGPSAPAPAYPDHPPLPTAPLADAQLADKFRDSLEAQGGSFEWAADDEGVLAVLADVFQREGISYAMASTDRIVAPLDLPGWAKRTGFTVTTQNDYTDRVAFKRAVFTEVQAGITGADFGLAESGTLCLLAGRDMPRLTSLAPIIHIAVLPASRLVAAYERMAQTVFREKPPSQVVLISGPSMTGDIQATPFKGMHGPKKLIVILKDKNHIDSR